MSPLSFNPAVPPAPPPGPGPAPGPAPAVPRGPGPGAQGDEKLRHSSAPAQPLALTSAQETDYSLIADPKYNRDRALKQYCLLKEDEKFTTTAIFFNRFGVFAQGMNCKTGQGTQYWGLPQDTGMQCVYAPRIPELPLLGHIIEKSVITWKETWDDRTPNERSVSYLNNEIAETIQDTHLLDLTELRQQRRKEEEEATKATGLVVVNNTGKDIRVTLMIDESRRAKENCFRIKIDKRMLVPIFNGSSLPPPEFVYECQFKAKRMTFDLCEKGQFIRISSVDVKDCNSQRFVYMIESKPDEYFVLNALPRELSEKELDDCVFRQVYRGDFNTEFDLEAGGVSKRFGSVLLMYNPSTRERTVHYASLSSDRFSLTKAKFHHKTFFLHIHIVAQEAFVNLKWSTHRMIEINGDETKLIAAGMIINQRVRRLAEELVPIISVPDTKNVMNKLAKIIAEYVIPNNSLRPMTLQRAQEQIKNSQSVLGGREISIAKFSRLGTVVITNPEADGKRRLFYASHLADQLADLGTHDIPNIDKFYLESHDGSVQFRQNIEIQHFFINNEHAERIEEFDKCVRVQPEDFSDELYPA